MTDTAPLVRHTAPAPARSRSIVRVALFDETDRVLLLRHAAGRTPGLGDLLSGTSSGREQPEEAAR
ncbi:hypothetical protein GCM10017667_53900 [Streptomyces filamentosus]|uniref:NUDIX hydrolase n=1 Tax=Streptomyces filamentosus TaxID=67294 RepID=A0A919BT56_STRFL|nr:hypothetical protein GCM10017667_53900 [Streptomyces filamentosus]